MTYHQQIMASNSKYKMVGGIPGPFGAPETLFNKCTPNIEMGNWNVLGSENTACADSNVCRQGICQRDDIGCSNLLDGSCLASNSKISCNGGLDTDCYAYNHFANGAEDPQIVLKDVQLHDIPTNKGIYPGRGYDALTHVTPRDEFNSKQFANISSGGHFTYGQAYSKQCSQYAVRNCCDKDYLQIQSVIRGYATANPWTVIDTKDARTSGIDFGKLLNATLGQYGIGVEQINSFNTALSGILSPRVASSNLTVESTIRDASDLIRSYMSDINKFKNKPVYKDLQYIITKINELLSTFNAVSKLVTQNGTSKTTETNGVTTTTKDGDVTITTQRVLYFPSAWYKGPQYPSADSNGWKEDTWAKHGDIGICNSLVN